MRTEEEEEEEEGEQTYFGNGVPHTILYSSIHCGRGGTEKNTALCSSLLRKFCLPDSQ